MSQDSFASIRKLQGRANWDTWKFAVQAYLEHEDLWSAVTNDDNEKKSTKARSKIILLIDEINYTHVKTTKTAKEAWENLQKAFEDTGMCRRMGLLDVLCNTKLKNCSSIEVYVDKITTAASKLTGIGFEVSDEWVGMLLLFGLPDEYKPMIIGIDSSGQAISSDSVKTKLLQDIKMYSPSTSTALMGKKSVPRQNKSVRCFNCNRFGHFANKCPNRDSSKTFEVKGQKKSALFTSFVTTTKSTDDWYVDSGASAHMVTQGDLFVDKMWQPSNNEVITANNSRLKVEAIGDVQLKIAEDYVDVKDVLLVPELCVNLLSVSQMVRKGNKVVFDKNGCKVYNSTNEAVVTASEVNGMFKLDQPEDNMAMVNIVKESQSIELWHRRLGHLNFNSLEKLKSVGADGIVLTKNTSHTKKILEGCSTCLQGKQTRLPFKHVAVRATKMLELIHSDVGGPIECDSLGGSRFYVVFVDDFTRKVFVYILKTKSEVPQVFSDFKQFVENQTGKKIQILRTDNGTEYVNASLLSILRKSGILHQKTAPYTPEQNGVAERMNRTLVERSRCMIFDAKLDKSYWAEAISTAAYVINRSPCRMIKGNTPEEMWSGRNTDLKRLRVFGCTCWVHVPKQKRKKFDPKSEKGIFVGYSEVSKAYRVYFPEEDRLVISRDVVFFENQPYGKQVILKSDNTNYFNISSDGTDSVGVEEASVADATPPSVSQIIVPQFQDSTTQGDVTPEDDTTVVNESSENISLDSSSPGSELGETFHSTFEDSSIIRRRDSDCDFIPLEAVDIEINVDHPRRSQRQPKPVLFDDFVSYNISTGISIDPISVQDALNRTDRKCWIEAMECEYKALLENKTWELVDLPPDRKKIDCKWIFKTKRDASGQTIRHKARLVVKGCSQRQGIDYKETFSPVVRYSSIRMLLALSAKFNLDIDQMDAVTAFLQGDLEEEIFMTQPEGFAKNMKVCRLKKSLYGLKQASRVWNIKLDAALLSSNLTKSNVDSCVYYKVDGSSMIFVTVYVDDLLIFTNDQSMKLEVKANLMSIFKMKDMGQAHQVLGIRITRDRIEGKIWFDQQQYIEEILTRFHMDDCNPVASPIDINQKLSSESCAKTDLERKEMVDVPYQAAVGSILFAAQVSRPDVCYAINLVSRFNKNPGRAHWTAVKRILRYLKATASAKLCFDRNEISNLVGYCDADFASDPDQRRSTTGYVFMCQGGPISWSSRRQPTIALSTTEAEYMALSAATQEAMWLNSLRSELIIDDTSQCVPIHCDNKSAINLASVSSYHPRTKHIDVRHHFVRDMVNSGKVKPTYIPTDDMKADILTKGLNRDKHNKMVKLLGLQL